MCISLVTQKNPSTHTDMQLQLDKEHAQNIKVARASLSITLKPNVDTLCSSQTMRKWAFAFVRTEELQKRHKGK